MHSFRQSICFRLELFKSLYFLLILANCSDSGKFISFFIINPNINLYTHISTSSCILFYVISGDLNGNYKYYFIVYYLINSSNYYLKIWSRVGISSKKVIKLIKVTGFIVEIIGRMIFPHRQLKSN